MLYRERIIDLREDKLMKQKDIADLLFVSQRTYSDYETGRIKIPVDCLIRLARYYDVSMDYISGVTNDRKPFPKG